MSDGEHLVWILFVVAVGAVAVVVTALASPSRPCFDATAAPGVACPHGASLVVEGGVGVCRCPADEGAP